jgi:hypothetical protein
MAVQAGRDAATIQLPPGFGRSSTKAPGWTPESEQQTVYAEVVKRPSGHFVIQPHL